MYNAYLAFYMYFVFNGGGGGGGVHSIVYSLPTPPFRCQFRYDVDFIFLNKNATFNVHIIFLIEFIQMNVPKWIWDIFSRFECECEVTFLEMAYPFSTVLKENFEIF